MARPSQSLADAREKTAGTVLHITDAGKRRARRRRTEDFDQAIVMAWRQHLAGDIGWNEAGERHHELVRLRDGRAVI